MAERIKETKASGDMQLYFPRVSSFFRSCINRIRFEHIMLRVRWWEYQNRVDRRYHCDKGYHNLIRNALTVTSSKKTRKVEYLKCNRCDFLFFSTRKDKQLYLDLTGNNRKRYKEAFQSYGGL